MNRKLRVLFLNPPFHPRFSREQRSPAVTKSGTFYYPMWLAYAAGYTELGGHEILLLDPPAKGVTLQDTLNRAREFGPDMVVMLTSTPSYPNDAQVATAFREAFPQANIGMVGTHASALPLHTMEHASAVDWCAQREYDATCREVADRVAGGQSLLGCKGLHWRDADGQVHGEPERGYITNLDELPFVSELYHRFLDIEDYFYSITRWPMLTIITGRGCPFHCNYCVYPQTIHGHKYNFRSPENVAAEFAYIEKTFPQLKEVFIEDDTFTVNRKRCQAIADLLVKQNNKVIFTVNSRADVDYETLAKLKPAGLRLMCVGIESGVQEVLDNVHKDITLEQIRTFFDDARKARVMVHGCFMVGNRGETHDTMHRTLEFAQELNPDTAQFFPLMVYPGTEAYDWAKENNFLSTTDFNEWLTDEGLHNSIVDTGKISPRELVEFCNYARKKFFLRPNYIARKMWQGLTDRAEMERNIMAAKVLSKYLFRKITLNESATTN